MKNLVKTMWLMVAMLMCSLTFAQTSKEYPKTVNVIKMTDAGVVVVATDDALYGLDSEGNELWKNEKLKKMEDKRVQVLSGSELIFVNDKGLLGKNRVLNVLTGQDYGNEHWGAGVGARVIHGMNQVWEYDGRNIIAVWDIKDNKHLYDLELHAPYGLATTGAGNYSASFAGMQPVTYTGSHTAILSLGLGHLGEYDLTTGKAKWMFNWKSYKIKKPHDGKGDRPSTPGRGYSIMKVDDASKTLYFPFREILIAVDMKTGAAKWDVKIHKNLGKVQDMHVTDEGLLILTYKGVQLLDKKTGVVKWDKAIKLKGAAESILFNDNGTFYSISKGSIIRIDVANRKSIVLTEKIKFKGGETLGDMEVFGDVLVMSSAHNAVGVDKKSGKILYTVYYKAPAASLATMAGNLALAGVAYANTMSSMRHAARTGNKYYYQYTPRMIKSKTTGSLDAGHLMYITTKFKDADTQGFGIARIDKRTGETTAKIVLDVREPIYAVSESSALVFYKDGKKKVTLKPVK